MSSKEKTRDQSLYEYLEALQVEYIQADLRKKIYPKQKDKNFWQKVIEFKKEKIEDIAERNNIPTIFNDKIVREQYRKKVFNDITYPVFQYKDEDERIEFEGKDFKYYYSVGAEMKVVVEGGEVLIGIVTEQIYSGAEFVKVKLRNTNQEFVYAIDCVSRIL